MPSSTTSLVFPDINVWVALSDQGHVHHTIANDWLDDVGRDVRFFFCRLTQLGLMRLLSTTAVMGDEALTQAEAWRAYDRWLQDDRVEFLDEPAGLESRFRTETRLRHPAPRDWADSYLVAFAAAAGLTIATFDRALGKKAGSSILLGE